MEEDEPSPLMPMLFVGHGSPTNATEENEFTRGWRAAAKNIPAPAAILCISAHWETTGTRISSGATPSTIHDFGGFPRALYEIQYPAAGHPLLAKEIRDIAGKAFVSADPLQGFDHGCWVPLLKMYPDAGIPVLQLSLDLGSRPAKHYEFAKRLAPLRRKGLLIVASGNMVHNLRMISATGLNNLNIPYAYDWAEEINGVFKEKIMAFDHQPLIEYEKLGKPARNAIPTPEHFLPLLYVLALQQEDEAVTFFNDAIVAGSLSMTSVLIGSG